jgi:hypothetical protein
MRNYNDRASNNGRPFFSRNIGLVQGVPVTILAGGKLSGEYGGFGIGALSVMTNETPTTPGQALSVARITHPIFSQSKLGIIFTNGDPTGGTKNTVAGADFQYMDSNFQKAKNDPALASREGARVVSPRRSRWSLERRRSGRRGERV